VKAGNREQGTENREQGTVLTAGYPQFSKSDKEKCTYFETPLAKAWHFFVVKIRETLINKWF
jgi:hypothetical protein